MNNYFKLKNFLLDLFFPKFCLGCQKEGAFLCQDCKETLEINEFDYCLCEKYPQTISPHSLNGKCTKCQNKKINGLFFALSYDEKSLTKKLIYQFKYPPYLKNIAKDLAEIISEHFILSGRSSEFFGNSILIPVPIHNKKLKLRGYNQSEELAKELSKILKIPVLTDILIKIKNTPSQMTLKKEEREKNLLNAFQINNEKPASALWTSARQRKIFLVDDVYTTGSTMQECAKTLKSAGFKNIWGITICRGE